MDMASMCESHKLTTSIAPHDGRNTQEAFSRRQGCRQKPPKDSRNSVGRLTFLTASIDSNLDTIISLLTRPAGLLDT